MILSKKQKFIFLRVPRTASTSLMHKILDLIPDENIDLRTSIDHKFFYETNLNTIPKNHKIFQEKFPVEQVTVNLSLPSSHPNIKDLIDNNILSPEELKEYSIYGVMRHPVDRFVSLANMNFNKLKLEMLSRNEVFANDNFHRYDIVEFFLEKRKIQNEVLKIDYTNNLLQVHDPAVLPQTHWLRFNGQNINKIFKYEDVSLLLKEITGKKFLNFHHNSKTRKDRSYDLPPKMIERIKELYEEDFLFWESLQH